MAEKLRIAFVLSQFPVISESFILNQITSLIDRGCSVDIYADKRGSDSITHEAVIRYDLIHRTRYLPQLPAGRMRRMGGACAKFIRQLKRDARKAGTYLLG